MEENLSKAFLVLFVGMLTVFVILSLVVLSGKALIAIINRFFPMLPEPVKVERKNQQMLEDKKIHPKKLAAIVAAVEVATGGRGTVTKVVRDS